MSIRYDHKGKYFTEVKRKEPVRARIQTADAQIIGTIHVHPENRLLDEINHPDLFLPVTDAVIDRAENRIQTPFIAINKEQIIWMVPLEEED